MIAAGGKERPMKFPPGWAMKKQPGEGKEIQAI
jgi:hypothetical protein